MSDRMTFTTKALCWLALLAAPMVSYAVGSHGVLIDVTMVSTVHPRGAKPYTYPGSKGRLCVSAFMNYPRGMANLLTREGCTMTEYRRHAGLISFTESCTHPAPESVYGEFHFTGESSFVGTMREVSAMPSGLFIVNEKFTGKRVGSCDYPQPAK